MGSLSFLQGAFQPRNRTGVSCIAGRFSINWLSGKPYLEANQPMKINRGALDQALPIFHTLVSPLNLERFYIFTSELGTTGGNY